jgi:polynucleotide 5'-hydroxyl-kinase GRC3/NOL9
MNRTVEKGKTLLIDGPASVTLASGKAEVFGSSLQSGNRVVIREGKRLPFFIEETATVDVSSGEGSVVEETEGNTLPASWTEAYEELRAIETKPTTAFVLGAVDSGKTSFCTYLVNRLVVSKKKVAILDGDLGQSDVGPPCTLAFAFVKKTVSDLFQLQTKNAFFVGTTSPNGAINKVIEGLKQLKKAILNENPEYIIIDTDGWVLEEDAIYYKIRLVEELDPDIVFLIQQKEELAPIFNALEEYRKVTVESPSATRERSTEKRRNLRELGYIKYLKNAKVTSLPLNWVKIEESEPLGLSKTYEDIREANKIYDMLGMKPLHFAKLEDRISIIIGRRRWIDEENVKKLEEYSKKKVVITRKGEEEGSIMALYGTDGKFRGIGTIQEVDYKRKTLKILTPVTGEISRIQIGKIRLDKNLKEIPVLNEENSGEIETQ